MLGIILLSLGMVMPLHSVGAIALVWFLHRVSLAPSNTPSHARHDVTQRINVLPIQRPRPDVTQCLTDLGIQPAGPDSRACINLALAERRQDRRHAGNDVPVFIFDDFGFCQGRVMNRSRGGLCIASDSKVTVGQSIRIQCQLDSNSAPSFDMEVCHVSKKGDEWIFGCKFLQEQDPSVLQLLG